MGQPSTLPYLIAGTILLAQGQESDGLYWLVPDFIASFILAFLDAWGLLVEVNR